MINNYLNQTAEYKAFVELDQYGGRTYKAVVIVHCRRQQVNREFIDPDGNRKVSECVYYLNQAVEAGGLLDGRLIAAVAPWSDLFGKTIGYRAVV